MSIIGVLAAVAVPAYQGYQRNAAFSAMTSDSNSISKSYLACTTVKTFANCNTLAKLGITLSGTPVNGGSSPLFCASFEREIGGVKYQQCVQTNASTGAVIRLNNEDLCHTDNDGSGNYNAGDVQATPITSCTGNPDCVAAGIGTVCGGGTNNGICTAGSGVCT